MRMSEDTDIYLQQTIKRPFACKGTCVYSGNSVQLKFFPAEPDIGIIFNTPKGTVKAALENIVPRKRSLELRDGAARVITVEHLLTPLHIYGIDNVYIEVRRLEPDENSSLMQSVAYYTRDYFDRHDLKTPEAVGNIDFESLCDLIEPEKQKAERKILRLREPFETDRISFYPVEECGVMMHVTTDHKPIGKQVVAFQMVPETYREELARARPYAAHLEFVSFLPNKVAHLIAKAVAHVWYPEFGIGHGFSEENVFLPTKTPEEWKAQERYPGEIPRHTIIDKYAPFALLDGRLDGVEVRIIPRSNHKNDIKVLKALAKRLTVKPKSSLLVEKELVLT